MITDNVIFISELFILPIIFIALGMISAANSFMRIEVPNHRYMALDGLRGFLALFVFIHHSSMWYMLSNTHQWILMNSTLFAHFGFTSVMQFFMITAFLFFSKLIDNYDKQIDWVNLYRARFFRIAPLYFFAVITIVILVGYSTHFVLKEPLGNLLLHIGQWMFMMEPDINGLRGTKYVVCGVQWSLAYEWLFYSSLAIVGLIFFRLRPAWSIVLATGLLAALFIAVIIFYYPATFGWDMCAFAGGIAAAFVSRSAKARKTLANDWFSVAAILLLCFAFTHKPSYSSFLAIIPFFIVVSCGNNLFGILAWRPCLLLGQISYSIYLLHGLILFTAFYLIIGLDNPRGPLPTVSYWLLICGLCVCLIMVCAFTYHYIEKAGIKHADAKNKKASKILNQI